MSSPPKRIITGHDEVVVLGKTALLSAKVEKEIVGYWRPNIKSCPVTFRIADDEIGVGVTDEQGIAWLKYCAREEGIYEIGYEIEKTKLEYRPGKLFVISPKTPVVISDIDGTISDYPDWKVPMRGGKAPTFPHAPEFLQKLAKKFLIVYLTARDDILDQVTLDFLQNHNFPEGPLIYNDWSKFLTRPSADFKSRILQQHQNKGLCIVAGIGNNHSDARAYRSVEIDAYIRGTEEIDGAIMFADYEALEQIWQEREEYYLRKISR